MPRPVDPRLVPWLAAAGGALAGAAAGVVGGPGGAVAGAMTGAALVSGGWWLGRRNTRPSQRSRVERSLTRNALTGAVPIAEGDLQLIRHAGHEVNRSVARTLELMRAALRGRSAIALWLDADGERVRVRAAETCADDLSGGPFDAGAGVIGILRKQTTPLILNDITPRPGFLPWYVDAGDVSHLAAIGLYDDGIRLGYLVIDRAEGQAPFDDIDAVALEAAAAEVVGALHTEKLVVGASRASRDMRVLYSAANALTEALTVDDVCSVAAGLVASFAPVDRVVVTHVVDEHGTQEVVFTDGDGVGVEVGHRFEDDASLAAVALRRHHDLPYSGRLERADTPIYGEGTPLRDARSLTIFPMIVGQQPVGTFAVASSEPGAYGTTQRDRLRLIVNYVATALANAMAYSRAVRMATTDGMTGLTNHRTFKERGAEALARAQRSRRPVSLIITDIDHFKKVNDTWGHATGDDVIRSVAAVLRDSLRQVDLGARYGGEEFAILLEDTDTPDAAGLAERLRIAVSELAFDGGGTPFSVTLSLGVATFPADAENLGDLIETADQALYTAKRGGRNRVICAAQRDRAAA